VLGVDCVSFEDLKIHAQFSFRHCDRNDKPDNKNSTNQKSPDSIKVNTLV